MVSAGFLCCFSVLSPGVFMVFGAFNVFAVLGVYAVFVVYLMCDQYVERLFA